MSRRCSRLRRQGRRRSWTRGRRLASAARASQDDDAIEPGESTAAGMRCCRRRRRLNRWTRSSHHDRRHRRSPASAATSSLRGRSPHGHSPHGRSTQREANGSCRHMIDMAEEAAVPAADQRAVLYAAGLLTWTLPRQPALPIGFIGVRRTWRRRLTFATAAPRRTKRLRRRAGRRRQHAVPAAAFAAGLSCALTGVAASSFGALYGSVGDGALASALPVVLSLLICGMGLNLLKVLPFEARSRSWVPGARLNTARLSVRRVDGARPGPATPQCRSSASSRRRATSLGAGLLLRTRSTRRSSDGSAKKFAAMRSSFEKVTPRRLAPRLRHVPDARGIVWRV